MNKPSTSYSTDFQSVILEWFQSAKRDLPWRRIRTPYRTWISEIMLQQTRVDQVIPYFERFMAAFPKVSSLASAEQEHVLKLWEGLGYYSRARNLHKAAQEIIANYEGVFPSSYDELINLKGIGPYTAAAIASQAFNEVKAVVDGNVLRVICRYVGIEEDIRKQTTIKEVQRFVDTHISKEEPGTFNEAVMELGALICTPKQPRCSECPLRPSCFAHRHVATDHIPYKSKAKPKPHHHIGIGIVLDSKGRMLIAKRKEDAMLGGLWEFPGGKKEPSESIETTVVREIHEELAIDVSISIGLTPIKHTYSHFSITLHPFICQWNSGTPKPVESQEIKWVTLEELPSYPFPKANLKLIDQLKDGLHGTQGHLFT